MTTRRFKVMAVTILGPTAPACGSSTETGSASTSEVPSVSTTIPTASTTAAAAAATTSTVATTTAVPSVYDVESGQPWTRNRLDYLSVDVPARLAVWPGTGE